MDLSVIVAVHTGHTWENYLEKEGKVFNTYKNILQIATLFSLFYNYNL